MSRAHRIALLDDHQMFLDGLSVLFSAHPERYTVEAYSDAVSLINAVKSGTEYDLVICDLIMKEMNGLSFISSLRDNNATLPVLMLSGINTMPPVKEIIKLGANGFVHKSADNGTLFSVVDTLIAGGTSFPDENDLRDEYDAQALTSGLEINGSEGEIPTLSPRQIEVLRLIANGASNRQISESMFISENTVKTHLKTIFYENGRQ